MSEIARQIVDYAQDDKTAEFRNAIHDAIQGKVMSHIEHMKQIMAQNMFNQPEHSQEQEVENA
jgi:hypothetical protein